LQDPFEILNSLFFQSKCQRFGLGTFSAIAHLQAARAVKNEKGKYLNHLVLLKELHDGDHRE
jgi:hypothetical protein